MGVVSSTTTANLNTPIIRIYIYIIYDRHTRRSNIYAPFLLTKRVRKTKYTKPHFLLYTCTPANIFLFMPCYYCCVLIYIGFLSVAPTHRWLGLGGSLQEHLLLSDLLRELLSTTSTWCDYISSTAVLKKKSQQGFSLEVCLSLGL